MVGIGGRAHVKRCQQCRRRKIKCDGRVPSCQRCTDSGRVCPGYEQKLEFVFFRSDPRTTLASQKVSLGTSSLEPQRPGRRKMGAESFDVIKDRAAFLKRPYKYPTLNLELGHSLSAAQNKMAFMTILHDRYVPELYFPDACGGQRDEIRSSWIAMASNLASSSEYSDMLGDSLLAMSMSLAAAEGQATQFSTTGLKHYSLALTRLRHGLLRGPLDLDDHQADISLVTCLCCGMYEMMANRSLLSLIKHLGGVGAILKGRGVEKLQTPISRRTFYEYRTIQLPVDLASRQASFLSSPEWINPPWKKSEQQSATRVQAITDIAFLIPVLMQNFDLMQQTAQISDHKTYLEGLCQLMSQALNVQKSLDAWELRFGGCDETSQLYNYRPATRIENSEAYDFENMYPISLIFPTWETGCAVIYLEMSRIYLNDLLMAIQKAIQKLNTSPGMVGTQDLTKQSIACADRICQSIEWFFEDHKKMIGRMAVLAPFQVAKGLFAQLCEAGTDDQELDASLKEKSKFCAAVTQRIKDGGLPIWEG